MLLSTIVARSFLLMRVPFCERNVLFCSVGGHLWYFLILAFMNSVAVNSVLGVQAHKFVGHILRSGVCGWVIGRNISNVSG